MKKRVVIIHGWADKPERGWLGWLAMQLRERGYEVSNPAMPNAKKPSITEWVETVRQTVGTLDENTILVGHSLGTYVLLRYLSEYSQSDKAKALILVSGFLSVKPHNDTSNTEKIDHKKYFSPAPDLKLVQDKATEIYHIYSDDDTMVEPARSKELVYLLGGYPLELHSMGHFLSRDLTEFPELLKVIDIINTVE